MLLLKMKAMSVSPYALLESFLFLYMLSLKSVMEQLQVRHLACIQQILHNSIYKAVHLITTRLHFYIF